MSSLLLVTNHQLTQQASLEIHSACILWCCLEASYRTGILPASMVHMKWQGRVYKGSKLFKYSLPLYFIRLLFHLFWLLFPWTCLVKINSLHPYSCMRDLFSETISNHGCVVALGTGEFNVEFFSGLYCNLKAADEITVFMVNNNCRALRPNTTIRLYETL